MNYQVINFEYNSNFTDIKNKLKTIILECSFKFPIQDLNHLLKGKEWGYRFDDPEEILVLLLQYSDKNEQETLIFDYFNYDTWKKHRVIIRYGRVIDTQIRKSHEFFDIPKDKNEIKMTETSTDNLLYKIRESIQKGYSLFFPLTESVTGFINVEKGLVIRSTGIYEFIGDKVITENSVGLKNTQYYKNDDWELTEKSDIFLSPFISMSDVGGRKILSSSELTILNNMMRDLHSGFLLGALNDPKIKEKILIELNLYKNKIPADVSVIFHLENWDICVIITNEGYYYKYGNITLGSHTYFGSQEPREGYSLTSKHGVYSPSDIRLDTRNHPIITISTTDTVTKLEPLFSDILLAYSVHYILSSIDPSDFEKIDKAKIEKDKIQYELRSIDRDIESLKKKRAELEKSISSRLEKLFENNENECRICK